MTSQRTESPQTKNERGAVRDPNVAQHLLDEASTLTSRRTASGDTIFRGVVGGCAVLLILSIVAIGIFVGNEAAPALKHFGILSFLASDRWAPSEAATAPAGHNPYGILQFIYGTAITSVIAMIIAITVSVAVALFITDIGPAWSRRPMSYLVDLLAAIPSVVFGFWGIFALIPALQPIGVGATETLGRIPVIGKAFAGPFFGVSYFTAGVVLAIMILPIVTALCREVFDTTPLADKEAAVGLGATHWEMIRMAVLPRSHTGIIGAAILGLGRAFGETIAVTMVIGNNVLGITTSIFGQGATMPSVIANEFTEATEPFHRQSLFVVAMWLLVLALIANIGGKAVIRRAERVRR